MKVNRPAPVADAANRTPNPALARLRVEKLENLARAFRADPGNLAEIGDRSPLDLLQRYEMGQQGTFARRPDPGDFLKPRFATVLFAQLAVRRDPEPMRLLAQPLNKIQQRG